MFRTSVIMEAGSGRGQIGGRAGGERVRGAHGKPPQASGNRFYRHKQNRSTLFPNKSSLIMNRANRRAD